MGHVYRKPGRHIWNLKYYVHGSPVYESARTSVKSEAITLLRQREGAVANGHALPKAGRLTVASALKAVELDYENNQRASLTNLQYRIKLHLGKYFGAEKMVRIRTEHIKTYCKARLDEGAARATVNRELAILKRAFRLAIQAGDLTSMPYIPMLEERNARTGFFEKDELEALCRELPATLRPVMVFAYYTGWRVRSEIFPLTWARVDREAIYLEPEKTKNREGRTFPYASVPALKKLIDEQKKKRNGPFVFPDEKGERLTNWYAETWRAACERARLSGKIPHDFRRTAVRNLVRAGVSEKTAMMLTGHKTRSVFDRYDIVTLADLKTAASRIKG